MKNINQYYFERTHSPFIPKYRLISGLFIGIIYAFIFYSFLYITRESFRLLTADENYSLWVLNDNEIRFYNLFFAFLSVIFSLSICFSFWFERPRKIFGRYQFKAKRILSYQRGLNWYFIFWFSKMALIFACLFGIPNFFYTFSLYPEYNFLFYLIIIVLFFNTWIPYLQQLKRKAYTWIFISIPIVIAISLGLSKINLIDYKKVNNLVLQKNVYFKYNLQLPESENYSVLERAALVENIFIVNDTNKQTQIIIDNQIVNISELGIYIQKWAQMRDEWDRCYIKYQFHIDKDIKMSYVNKLEQELSFQNVEKINFAVKPIKAQYNQMYYYYYSIEMRIPGNIAINEENRNSDNFENIIKIKLTDNCKCYINDSITEYSLIKNTIKSYILQNPNYLIKFNVSNNSTFESYIRIFSGIKQAINELRNEYAIKTYSKGFDKLKEELQMQIYRKYPFYLLELPYNKSD